MRSTRLVLRHMPRLLRYMYVPGYATEGTQPSLAFLDFDYPPILKCEDTVGLIKNSTVVGNE